MFGIDLMENFKNLYLANNIREFWGRWHIALSTWFRDYLYIPLGGKKNNFLRNLLIVFVLSGLWNGANWTFIPWGTLHGFYLLFTIILLKNLPFLSKPNYSILGKILTFGFVTFSWIFFRASSIHDAWVIVSNLGNLNHLYLFDILYQLKIGESDITSWARPLILAYGKIYVQYSIGDLLLSCLLIPLLISIEYLMHSRPPILVKFYHQSIFLLLSIDDVHCFFWRFFQYSIHLFPILGSESQLAFAQHTFVDIIFPIDHVYQYNYHKRLTRTRA